MRVSTKSFSHGHDVCGAQAAANWVEGKSVSFHVLHISPEGVRHRCPRPPLTGTHSHQSTTADNSSHPTIPRWDESLCVT